MQATIRFIAEELGTFYPPGEVDSFIRLIAESVWGLGYSDLVLKQFRPVNPEENDRILEIVARLKNHEPIQYVLGETEFYGNRFKVSPAVLIPRPETEELVDWILKSEIKPEAKILDIGTGSGCIAISLKKGNPDFEVTAMDISEEALLVANENAALNRSEIKFFRYDILSSEPLPRQVWDVIVSNPPYVTESEQQIMNTNVLEFEPKLALFVPDADSLIFYKAIIRFAGIHLNEGGFLFLEINEKFGAEMATLLTRSGYKVELKKDINGRDRMVKAMKVFTS
jgi:release factor glutamine methyltransferase